MQTQAQPVAAAPANAGSSQAVRKHKEYLFPAVTMYYKEPIALERGEGEYVWDDQGNKYLDCFGGVLTVSVGHNNPAGTEAVVEQVKKLAHTSTLYANGPQSDLAEKLAQERYILAEDVRGIVQDAGRQWDSLMGPAKPTTQGQAR